MFRLGRNCGIIERTRPRGAGTPTRSLTNRPDVTRRWLMGTIVPDLPLCQKWFVHPTHAALSQRPADSSCSLSVEGTAA